MAAQLLLFEKAVNSKPTERAQAGDSRVVQEVGAVPGPWPGIWSCDYKNLSLIYVHTATASVAVQNGDLQLGKVSR